MRPLGNDNASPTCAILRRVADVPELNVAVFAFLLNYPWEFLQAPFFQGMAAVPHWEAMKACTQATIGDAAIVLVAFWAVAAAVCSRRWILAPTGRSVVGFAGVGVAITVVVERLATGPLDQWAYADAMPIVPIVEVGLLPLLQWILLPPLILWFVRRQLT